MVGGDAREWHSLTAWKRSPPAAQMALVTLDVPAGLRTSYQVPGQYVWVRTPSGEAPFALASVPGEPFELLVKQAAGAAEFLMRASPGTPLSITPASGSGFRLDDVTAETPVLLCATGSGIAPIRPLFKTLIARGNHPRLLYGSTLGGAFAFHDELDAAVRERKATMELFVSREDDDRQRARGRLVSALQPGTFDYRHCIAFLVGVPAMISEATARLIALGVHPANVRLNY